MSASVTLNTKIDPSEKERFIEIAESLGMSASSALKVLIRKFNTVGGFPFMVRREPTIDFNSPNLFRPKVEGKTVILPASWRDEDDDE